MWTGALLLLLLLPLAGWVMRGRGWSAWRALGVGAAVLLALFVAHRIGATSDETKVERAITAVETSGDPRVCDELMTVRYLEASTGVAEPFADDACKSNVGAHAASVDFSRVEVDGDHATAVVRGAGGPSADSLVRLELVQVGGHWKLDRAAILDFDRQRWNRVFRLSLTGGGYSTQATDCVLRRARDLSDAEIKRLVLDDPHWAFTSMIVGCDRAKVEGELTSTAGGPEYGLPRRVASCVDRGVGAVSDTELVRLRNDPAALNLLIVDCGRGAYLQFLKRRLVDSGYVETPEAECVVTRLDGLSSRALIRLYYDDSRYEGLVERCESEASAPS